MEPAPPPMLTMRRLLKLLAWFAGIVVALLIVAALVLTLVIDPNDFRDDINAAVERRTGRSLVIHGDLELSLFPWLGTQVEQVEFGNAPGFGPEPFARLSRADIKVKLLPLLRKEVEVDTVTLHGLVLNLARSESGQTNWADLQRQAGEPRPQRQRPPGAALAGLAVGGVRLTDARVEWSDRLAGQRLSLTHLNLSTGALEPGSVVPIETGFDFAATSPEARGRVEFAAEARLDPEAERYGLQDAVLRTEVHSPLLPQSPLEASLAFDAGMDLRQETMQISPLVLTAMGSRIDGTGEISGLLSQPRAAGGLKLAVEEPGRLGKIIGSALGTEPRSDALEGSELRLVYTLDLAAETLSLSDIQGTLLRIPVRAEASGSQILQMPQFRGTLALEPFKPRDILAALGIEEALVADPTALAHAALETRFEGSPRQVALTSLKARLDDSTLTGNLTLGERERPAVRYELQLDAINLDRYLPPPTDAEPESVPPPPTAGGAAAAAAGELPLDLLRELALDGRLQIGRLQAMNLKSSDVVVGVNGREGLFRLQPLQARLYEGRYSGNVTLDVRGQTPRLGMDESLTGVQMGPLLTDLFGKEYMSGVASVRGRLNARGLEAMEVRRTLNGTAELSVENGAVKGVNIGHLIRQAYALYQRQPAPKEETRETDFTALSATLSIKDGVVSNRDLSAKSPLLRVEGEGTVNLVSEKIDYLVKAAVVRTLEGQGGRELEEVKNITIPIRVGGTLGDPSWKVDLDPVLKARAEAALEREKKRVEERLKEPLEERREELKRGLEKGLEDLFKRR